MTNTIILEYMLWGGGGMHPLPSSFHHWWNQKIFKGQGVKISCMQKCFFSHPPPPPLLESKVRGVGRGENVHECKLRFLYVLWRKLFFFIKKLFSSNIFPLDQKNPIFTPSDPLMDVTCPWLSDHPITSKPRSDPGFHNSRPVF